MTYIQDLAQFLGEGGMASLFILISLNPTPLNFTASPLPVAMVLNRLCPQKYGDNNEIPRRFEIFGVQLPANPHFPRNPGRVADDGEGLICPHPIPFPNGALRL